MGAPRFIRHPVALRPGVLAALAAAYPDRYPVVLDSAANGPLAQFSLLAANVRGSLVKHADGRLQTGGDQPPPTSILKGGFLDSLRAWMTLESQPALPEAGTPFHGGWFVYLGYEMASEVEARLVLPQGDLPQAFALRVPMAVIEQSDGQAFIICEPDVTEVQLAQVRDDLAQVPLPTSSPLEITGVFEEAPERYERRVRRAQDYIRAGDVYQANLSRPWRFELAEGTTAGQVYERLRIANPAPFAALAQYAGVHLLSSSPERLVRITGSRLNTRPIAGTHRRGATPEEDQDLAAQLIAHPKERAEHVMLIDLERNDLGRVCEAGSVQVDEYMAVETYAHVHHIVSNVTGQLRKDKDAIDVLRAVFPGGTITGCPKLRCMEIIAELEAEARGAYTGSLGYLNRDGSGDFNILIRTMTLHGREIRFRAGAGIVADSDPTRELHETRAKARGMLLALGQRGDTP
ncbi:MAG: aminodeoxychorismate synthase component I [Proteobacteria bacterium]|nr:aminodeoxychorismate synthase component I [Pseudomonadota bacterium]